MNEGTIAIGVLHIITALLIIAVSIPLVQNSVKMNSLYGIRIKKAYESEENWYKINEYGGKRLIFWSIVLICIGILTFFINVSEKSFFYKVIALAPVIVLIPCIIEIYIFAKKL